MKRFILPLLFIAYTSGVTSYALPYAKADLTRYATHKMESAIVALNGRPSLKVKLDESLVAQKSEALPPSKNISELAQYDTDIVKQLLEQN